MSVATGQLESSCHVINELKNNAKCPCDVEELQLLYEVRYSLAEYYCCHCYYPDGKITEMKLLSSDTILMPCSIIIFKFFYFRLYKCVNGYPHNNHNGFYNHL